ncbi:hypothetical protein ARMGADRAFT_1075929 [Armillaria gallica]|uniref:Uncharacterized protein n=1 Tax=Armillaria gallica TaxID=47427 RepID=A0A2H3EA32_ARMGA|nr:hypothetical protein ARMGADRAFT_1075929 [Armillaria gallica]
MSIITLARPFKLYTRSLSTITITQYLTAAHKRETTRLQDFYETQLSQLRQELKPLRNATLKWEQREKQKRRNERIKRKQQDSERKRRQEPEPEPEREQERSVEAQLMCDKIKLLHEIARLSRAVSATSSLDPTLQEDEVDKAGHDLYRACLPLQEQDSQPIVLREGQISLPSVAAFFALAHWSKAGISVDYLLESDKVAASYIKQLMDAHERKITRLQGLYEKKLVKLWKEWYSLINAKSKRESREQRKRWERIRKREREERQERELERKQDQEESERSLTELQLTHDKIELLHKVAWHGENLSAASSLDIIDSIYRRHLEDTLPPGTQSVLSAIINGALDEPSHTYAYSRQKAISLLDPTLKTEEVDEAGHDLYRDCVDHVPIQPYRQPIDLKEGQLRLPSVAAYFALAHWSQVEISVYFLKGDEVVASIEDSFEGD